jgi:cell division protein FtsB
MTVIAAPQGPDSAGAPEAISPRAVSGGVAPGSGLPLPRRRRQWVQGAVIFAGCVVLVNALFGDRGLVATTQARAESQRALATLTHLKHENAGLREQARRLQEDPLAIETLAREDLGLIRPGEILVVVTDVK